MISMGRISAAHQACQIMPLLSSRTRGQQPDLIGSSSFFVIFSRLGCLLDVLGSSWACSSAENVSTENIAAEIFNYFFGRPLDGRRTAMGRTLVGRPSDGRWKVVEGSRNASTTANGCQTAVQQPSDSRPTTVRRLPTQKKIGRNKCVSNDISRPNHKFCAKIVKSELSLTVFDLFKALANGWPEDAEKCTS